MLVALLLQVELGMVGVLGALGALLGAGRAGASGLQGPAPVTAATALLKKNALSDRSAEPFHTAHLIQKGIKYNPI